MPETILLGSAATLLLVGAIEDWRLGTLDNSLTFGLILIGLILSIFLGRWDYLVYAGIVFAGVSILWFFHRIGGGDVKLLTGLTLIVGIYGATSILIVGGLGAVVWWWKLRKHHPWIRLGVFIGLPGAGFVYTKMFLKVIGG